MIDNLPDVFRNITKVTVLDRRKVFYPLRYFLQQRDIRFDENSADILQMELLPENITYPGDAKLSDAGMLHNYKVAWVLNNQAKYNADQLLRWQGRKVILVLHYTYGRFVLGSNDMPFFFMYSERNSADPEATTGYDVVCSGNTLIPKVIR